MRGKKYPGRQSENWGARLGGRDGLHTGEPCKLWSICMTRDIWLYNLSTKIICVFHFQARRRNLKVGFDGWECLVLESVPISGLTWFLGCRAAVFRWTKHSVWCWASIHPSSVWRSLGSNPWLLLFDLSSQKKCAIGTYAWAQNILLNRWALNKA